MYLCKTMNSHISMVFIIVLYLLTNNTICDVNQLLSN